MPPPMSTNAGRWPRSRSASTSSRLSRSARDAVAPPRSRRGGSARRRWRAACRVPAGQKRSTSASISCGARPKRVGGRPREVGREPQRDRHVAARTRGDLGQQPQLVLVVDHDRGARGDAQLEQRARLDRCGHDDVGGRHAARRAPGAARARSATSTPEPARARLVDERERLVGLAGEEDLEVDADERRPRPGAPPALRASGAGSRTLSGDPCARSTPRAARAARRARSARARGAPAAARRPHSPLAPGSAIGGLQVHAHAGAPLAATSRRASSRYCSRQRCTTPAGPAIGLRMQRAAERVVADHGVLGRPADRRRGPA